jgi:polyhydroxyalkanoate synthase subunit PhaC
MSIVQIFPRAEEPSAQVVSVNPVVEPGASTTSPEPPAGMPVAVDPLPVSEPYPLDRAFHAMLARLTGGISPLALSLAWLDWSSHLASTPQRQV